MPKELDSAEHLDNIKLFLLQLITSSIDGFISGEEPLVQIIDAALKSFPQYNQLPPPPLQSGGVSHGDTTHKNHHHHRHHHIYTRITTPSSSSFPTTASSALLSGADDRDLNSLAVFLSQQLSATQYKLAQSEARLKLFELLQVILCIFLNIFIWHLLLCFFHTINDYYIY
jgi:hypothetical protein